MNKSICGSPSRLLPLIVATVLLLGACATDVGEGDDASAINGLPQAIINGTPVNPEYGAVVRVLHYNTVRRSWSTCSGTLVRNDAILTARHCMTTDDTPNGPVDGNTTLYFANVGAQWKLIRSIVPIAGQGNDVGLLFTSGSFIVNNGVTQDGTGQKLIATPSSTQSLDHQNVYCAGYGGDGVTLRLGLLTLAWGGTSILFVDPGPTGQGILEHGDSGGPCFRYENGIPRIVGVAARENAITGPDLFRAWLNQQVCAQSLMPGACLP